MNPNWHTWELEFDDLPMQIGAHRVGYHSGVAMMAGSEIEAIWINDQRRGSGCLKLGPRDPLYWHFHDALQADYGFKIRGWRDEVAA